MGTDGGFQGKEGDQRDGSEGKGEGHGEGYGSICWETSLDSVLCQDKHPCSAVLEEEQEPVAL